MIWLGSILSMLTLFPHELLHAICFREDVYLYTNLAQGMLFVIGPETMTRRRKVWHAPAIWAGILCGSAAICFIMSHIRGAVLLGWVLTLAGLGLPMSYFASFASSLKQQILSQGLKRPKNVYTLVLADNAKGISVSNETEHADYPWKKIHHIYRDLTATYLFITKDRAFILPHQCIEEGEDALWDLISRKVDSSRCTILK